MRLRLVLTTLLTLTACTHRSAGPEAPLWRRAAVDPSDLRYQCEHKKDCAREVEVLDVRDSRTTLDDLSIGDRTTREDKIYPDVVLDPRQYWIAFTRQTPGGASLCYGRLASFAPICQSGFDQVDSLRWHGEQLYFDYEIGAHGYAARLMPETGLIERFPAARTLSLLPPSDRLKFEYLPGPGQFQITGKNIKSLELPIDWLSFIWIDPNGQLILPDLLFKRAKEMDPELAKAEHLRSSWQVPLIDTQVDRESPGQLLWAIIAGNETRIYGNRGLIFKGPGEIRAPARISSRLWRIQIDEPKLHFAYYDSQEGKLLSAPPTELTDETLSEGAAGWSRPKLLQEGIVLTRFSSSGKKPFSIATDTISGGLKLLVDNQELGRFDSVGVYRSPLEKQLESPVSDLDVFKDFNYVGAAGRRIHGSDAVGARYELYFNHAPIYRTDLQFGSTPRLADVVLGKKAYYLLLSTYAGDGCPVLLRVFEIEKDKPVQVRTLGNCNDPKIEKHAKTGGARVCFAGSAGSTPGTFRKAVCEELD